ncbi:SDR family NAD(P)-dependent oxidoreductase [Streptomyces sp. NPDC088261]|uniref:SDR family NAD(P)-dependent oxidoreductase n=1 Tax=Streptomyces sp. NPDC088261 TaxID=3365851 RepID=UPI003820BD5F
MQGRNALVTGATGGIGRAVAMALAREGATVVVSGRDTERGEDIVRRIGDEGGKAVFVRADLGAGGQAVRDLARDATAAVGVIDVLVNNAAVLIPAQSMLDATEEQIDQALAVNVKAPFLLTACLVPSMVERGGGAVVNMGSINGETGMSVAALYGASKAGLHSLTKSWAAELAARNVRVNTVAPGPTVTEHNAAYKDMLENLTTAHPRRRPGTAEEVAAAVVFLAGDDATHIHGVTLPVDGGFLAV